MHGMMTYFIRRLMLVPVTFIVITLMVYTILRLVPGGPVEQAIMLHEQAAAQGGDGAGEELQMSEKQILALQEYYRVDKPIPVGYAIWLGGVVRGDFQRSTHTQEPVLDAVASRFPISLPFGLAGFFATYLVCIPLGVLKAIRHRTHFDTFSSILVFAGYAIPGFVACLLLIVLIGGGNTLPGLDDPLAWVPKKGHKSDPSDYDQMTTGERFWDRIHHAIVPVLGYLIGSFATMTILMKNSLLENLGADYVRTAFAKGLPERRVIFVHAFRNSLIPVTAGLGHFLGLLFAGSFLIEQACSIQGFGVLGIQSIFQKDYPIIMGLLVFGVLISLFGNILSDLIWAGIDPRIRFK